MAAVVPARRRRRPADRYLDGHPTLASGGAAFLGSLAAWLIIVALSKLAPSIAPTTPINPPSSPPPGCRPRVEDAIVRLSVGRSGCTGTVIEGRSPGEYFVLTAAHCWGGGATQGSIKLNDGRIYPVRLLHRSWTPDIAVATFSTAEPVSFAKVRQELPNLGAQVWHRGFGVRNPGSHEKGKIEAHNKTRSEFRISIDSSPGDSGSGIFEEGTDLVVAVLWGHDSRMTLASDTSSVLRAIESAKTRLTAMDDWSWEPEPTRTIPGG